MSEGSFYIPIYPVFPESDYEGYLVTYNKKGFHCVLDGKSSFRFEIKGDSITTPQNGMNGLNWNPANKQLTVTGTEKGVSYATIYTPILMNLYPKTCTDEEREWFGSVTAVFDRGAKPRILTARKTKQPIDLLGRNPTLRLLAPL